MRSDREFQFDDYYKGWKTLLTIGSYEFKVVFGSTHFKNQEKVKQTLEEIDNRYLERMVNKCHEAFLLVNKKYHDIGEDYAPSFTLDAIFFVDEEQVEFQFYMYLTDKNEGDNYGAWVATFHNNKLTDAKRIQI